MNVAKAAICARSVLGRMEYRVWAGDIALHIFGQVRGSELRLQAQLSVLAESHEAVTNMPISSPTPMPELSLEALNPKHLNP